MYKERDFFFHDFLKSPQTFCREQNDPYCEPSANILMNPFESWIDLSKKRSNRSKNMDPGKPFLLPYDKQPKDQIRKNFFLQIKSRKIYSSEGFFLHRRHQHLQQRFCLLLQTK